MKLRFLEKIVSEIHEGESFGEGPPNVELDSYNDCDDLLSPSSRMHSNRFITSLVFSVSRNFF